MEERDEMAIKLIEFIRENPTLLSRYIKADDRNRMWEEISEKLGISGPSAKRKWARIKYLYDKYKNYKITEGMSRYLAEWKSTYEPLLSFLQIESLSPQRVDNSAHQSQLDTNFGMLKDVSLENDSVKSKKDFTSDKPLENVKAKTNEHFTLNESMEKVTVEPEEFTINETIENDTPEPNEDLRLNETLENVVVESKKDFTLNETIEDGKPRPNEGFKLDESPKNDTVKPKKDYTSDESATEKKYSPIHDTVGTNFYSQSSVVTPFTELSSSSVSVGNNNCLATSYINGQPLSSPSSILNLTSAPHTSVSSTDKILLDKTLNVKLENNDAHEISNVYTKKMTGGTANMCTYSQPLSSLSSTLTLTNSPFTSVSSTDNILLDNTVNVKVENTDADEISNLNTNKVISDAKTMCTYSHIEVKEEKPESTQNKSLPFSSLNSTVNLFPTPTTTIFSGVTQVSSTSPIFAATSPFMTSEPFVSFLAENFVKVPQHALTYLAQQNIQTSTGPSSAISSTTSKSSAPLSSFYANPATTTPVSSLFNRAPSAITVSNPITLTSLVNTPPVPPLIAFTKPTKPVPVISMPFVSLERLSEEEILKRTRKEPPICSSTSSDKPALPTPAVKKGFLEPYLTSSSTSYRPVQDSFLKKRLQKSLSLPKPRALAPASISIAPSGASFLILRGSAPATNSIAPSKATLTPKLTIKAPIPTHHMTNPVSRKRKANDPQEECLDKVLKYLQCKAKKDPVDILFKSYAKSLKKLQPRTQVKVKVKLAALFAKAELGVLNEF